MSDKINIEVAYATAERQKIITLEVTQGTTIIEAVRQSRITDIFPELDIESASFGIWSKVKPSSTVILEGQRIEIYRPLIIDPKESRRKRAEKKAAQSKKWRKGQK